LRTSAAECQRIAEAPYALVGVDECRDHAVVRELQRHGPGTGHVQDGSLDTRDFHRSLLPSMASSRSEDSRQAVYGRNDCGHPLEDFPVQKSVRTCLTSYGIRVASPMNRSGRPMNDHLTLRAKAREALQSGKLPTRKPAD